MQRSGYFEGIVDSSCTLAALGLLRGATPESHKLVRAEIDSEAEHTPRDVLS
jgi:hypothetical protein